MLFGYRISRTVIAQSTGGMAVFNDFPKNDQEMLLSLQYDTFKFFQKNTHPINGLIADKDQQGAPSSIASTGLGFAVYAVAEKRGWISRQNAVATILKGLRFLKNSSQSDAPDATGYKGFYYHFLDMNTGRRTWQSEISTIDSALLIVGALVAGAYFDGDNDHERELREIAEELYRRMDWGWALNGGNSIVHGWKPETGFLPSSWGEGYSEALILYILALGSPDHAISPQIYRDWTNTFHLEKFYDWTYLHAGPLFIHQLSHLWIDFRNIRDDFNRKVGFDYFKNSEWAARVQQAYAIENPGKFLKYSNVVWGITACDGPGPAHRIIDGREREFFGYVARGVFGGPDDGTLSPWVVVTSLPFAPDIVMPSIRHGFDVLRLGKIKRDGLEASYNFTFQEGDHWTSPWKFGVNEGPIILMLENFCSELIWGLTKKIPAIQSGLERAGFQRQTTDAEY